jgi:hypothetical protein
MAQNMTMARIAIMCRSIAKQRDGANPALCRHAPCPYLLLYWRRLVRSLAAKIGTAIERDRRWRLRHRIL